MKKFYVVFGLDGSGKTTLIKNYIEKNSNFKYFHFLPTNKNISNDYMLIKNNISEKIFTKENSFVENILSYFRIIKSLLITRIFYFKFLQNNFISDRYIYGYYAQPYPLKYFGNKNIAKFVIKISTRPQLCFFIDTPVEICFSRKPELPIEEMGEERNRWLELSKEINAKILDGSKGEENLLLQLESYINQDLLYS